MEAKEMDKILLSELMNGKWKEYSISTCADRAIPSAVDGLKPVQRFNLYSGFQNAKNDFSKVNGIASVVSKYGYEHGEQSATDALTKMGQYFSNNLPLFEGSGNFGNRLVPKPSAGRYIYAKLAKYIDLLYKDSEFAPDNEDPEILTKKYYLPIIPMVLVNGIQGIATGYACNIPPHSPISIIDCLIKYCKTGKYDGIKPDYYGFTGTVENTTNGYHLIAPIEQKSNIHFVIKDLPITEHDSESYEAVLRKLMEKGKIQSYDNMSVNDEFCFDINFKRGTSHTVEEVRSLLKLEFNDNLNLTTITPDGMLHIWENIDDLVKWFYDFRIPFVQKRIDAKLHELEELIAYLKGFIKFITDVMNRKLDLRNIDEPTLEEKVKTIYAVPDKYVERVMNAPMRTLTTTKKADLEAKLSDAEEEFKYYSNTTKEKEYINDLEVLKKAIIKYYKER